MSEQLPNIRGSKNVFLDGETSLESVVFTIADLTETSALYREMIGVVNQEQLDFVIKEYILQSQQLEAIEAEMQSLLCEQGVYAVTVSEVREQVRIIDEVRAALRAQLLELCERACQSSTENLSAGYDAVVEGLKRQNDDELKYIPLLAQAEYAKETAIRRLEELHRKEISCKRDVIWAEQRIKEFIATTGEKLRMPTVSPPKLPLRPPLSVAAETTVLNSEPEHATNLPLQVATFRQQLDDIPPPPLQLEKPRRNIFTRNTN